MEKVLTRYCGGCKKEKPFIDFCRDYRASTKKNCQCRACKKIAFVKWSNSESGKKYYLERSRTPKSKARMKLRYAVKTGKVKQFPCEVCGDPDTHGHHEDYSKPYDVQWLCREHHQQLHYQRSYPERSQSKV